MKTVCGDVKISLRNYQDESSSRSVQIHEAPPKISSLAASLELATRKESEHLFARDANYSAHRSNGPLPAIKLTLSSVRVNFIESHRTITELTICDFVKAFSSFGYQ